MTGIELFFGGIAAAGVLYLLVRARAGNRRAQAAAEIARAGTSPFSLVGRVLVTALVIFGIEWLVLTRSTNVTLQLVVLALPALVTAFTLTRVLTVVTVNPSRRAGGRR